MGLVGAGGLGLAFRQMHMSNYQELQLLCYLLLV